MNQITILGRLVRDPELRQTASGLSVTSFTVAVDRDVATNGQRETDFLDCVAWRKTAEFVSSYFSKGSMIALSGRLQIRPWTDKDGNKRRSAEIVAEHCYFASSKRDSGSDGSAGAYPNYPENYPRILDPDEGLPF